MTSAPPSLAVRAPARQAAQRFFAPFARDDRFRGTLPPALRASERPIAIACFRLVTFFPERPLRSVPRFRSRIARATFCSAFRPYLAMRVPPQRADRRRRFAALLAWRESARCDAAARPFRFKRRSDARARFAEVARAFAVYVPSARLLPACRAVGEGGRSPGGGGKATPALRAFDRPIAIACLADEAPCLPSRMWWISSRTNSPA